MGGPAELTAAESQLVNALRDGRPCDFLADDAAFTDMSTWGLERQIRADLLTDILHGRGQPHGLQATIPARLELRGAVIVGDFRLDDSGYTDNRSRNIVMAACRFDGEVDFASVRFRMANFGGCTFTGSARFTDAMFDQTAVFTQTTFYSVTDFQDVVFTEPGFFEQSIWFNQSMFCRAKFHEEAFFDDATSSTPLTFAGRPSTARHDSAAPLSAVARAFHRGRWGVLLT